MTVEGKTFEMLPGDVLPLDTSTRHTFKAVTDCLILEISKPSIISDNYFSDPRLGYKE
jgi:quercetin dioxygenase-like cupin family protein